MTEPDELLARVDAWLARPATLGLPVSLVRDLAVALRAALAAQPQPDTEAQKHRSPYWEDPDYQDWLNELMENAGDEWDGDDAMEAIALRYVRHLEAAAAGSAIPTTRLNSALGEHVWTKAGAGDDDEAVAGSATPTGDDDDRT